MKNKLKETFDTVRAGEELKDRTKAFLARETRRYTRKTPARYPALAAAACLLFILMGGSWLYFIPTARISIDVNPSIELGVNRFDKVVSVTAYNEDGQELADTLSIKFSDYGDAVNQVLENDQIAALLSNGEILTIAVIGPDSEQSVRILSDVESSTAERQNAYCYSAGEEEAAAAHDLGLSCGKYKAYLELKALNPEVTPEKIRDMTMREIRDCINSCSDEDENGTQTEHSDESGHHGNGSGHGHGSE